MNMSWGCGTFLATVFVLVNLIGQLGGCVMVIVRYKVPIACGVLFFIVVLQVCNAVFSIEVLMKANVCCCVICVTASLALTLQIL